MNLLVCFKIVHDLDSVMKRDWDNASLDGLDISYTMRVLNCYDEAALERALRLRDVLQAAGEETTVTAITVGNGNNDIFYKNMFAVGISRILQVETDEDLRFRPDAAAQVLARHAVGYDAIIMGRQSAIGGNGLTQYALAGALGIPCINNVLSIAPVDGGLRARFGTADGVRTATICTPAIYAMGNSDSPYLRVATLREKLAVAKMRPERLMEEIPKDEWFQPVTLYSKRQEKKCVFLTGSPEETARLLYEGYLKERLT